MAINRLAKAEKKKGVLVARFKETEEKYFNLVTALAQRQTHGMPVDELIRYEEHILFIKGQMRELEDEIADAEEQVVKARTHVLNKSKEKQIMEKLRDQQNLAWKLHLDKKETAQLDEIAVMRHDKKL